MPQDNLDPLRHIEGFPLGEDEDLHALSNPPYYTAYPNPHIADFIAQNGKPYDEATDDYQREPFVGDIATGVNNPVYAAHAYHTKVPPDIISTLIKHYSYPGDIVLDVFSGTGMTGVSARSLNRNCVLIDLAPISTLVSWVNNHRFDDWEKAVNLLKKISDETERELGYLYTTRDNLGHEGTIKYVVWSDVFTCPYCDFEFPFFPHGVNHLRGKVQTKKVFNCPNCHADLNVRTVRRIITPDGHKKKQVVWINANVGSKKQDREPSQYDLQLSQDIEKSNISYWYPTDMVNPDWYSARLGQLGQKKITSVDKFLAKRNLWIYSALFAKVNRIEDKNLQILCTYILTGVFTVISERQGYFGGGGGMSGNLYMPIIRKEQNVFQCLKRRLSKIKNAEKYKVSYRGKSIVSTQSSTTLQTIPSNSIDYIYTDPPFGANIIYSEMNSILESWLKVRTNNFTEAVINDFQGKTAHEYQALISATFAELFRVLKPGRWITVEFHNTQASIWNLIQDSLGRAGFIVAQTGTLNKGSSTILQDIRAGAVNNDIIISAFKPTIATTQKLASSFGVDSEMHLIQEHLSQLPISTNLERTREMLFSRYIAYYVRHGYKIAYNGEQFYRALTQWGLEERDSHWFADEAQAQEYEQRKIKGFGKKGVVPQAVLFISDERSARQWISNFLDQPKTYDEIYTAFVKALQTAQDEIPELKDLLEESFVRTNGHWKRPDQLTQAELEQKRLERLLRQFNEYLVAAKAGQKLKEVRKEAVVAGFTECYRAGRFQDIITVGNKLHKRLLEGSPELFDFVDIAEAKIQ
jgi:16S rRNA G966 N2-methylase RsmD